MIERVSGCTPDQPTVQVQFDQHSPDIGVGLELANTSGIPGDHHLIDVLYRNNVGEIGRIIRERMLQDGWTLAQARVGEVSDYGDDAMLGRVVLDAVSGSTADFGSPGFWTRLDRGSVNRLIRLFRKARDITFGPDA